MTDLLDKLERLILVMKLSAAVLMMRFKRWIRREPLIENPEMYEMTPEECEIYDGVNFSRGRYGTVRSIQDMDRNHQQVSIFLGDKVIPRGVDTIFPASFWVKFRHVRRD